MFAVPGTPNRRIQKSVGSDTYDYFHNESWQVVEEQHDDGTDTTVTDYAWDLAYVDQPILRMRDANGDDDVSDPGETLFYLTDANQNVTALVAKVDQGGGVYAWEVVERYVYDPFGRATVYDASWTVRSDSTDANTTAGDESAYGSEILYAGYRYDPETAIVNSTTAGTTGNYHVRNRQYHPTLGRFLQRDPIGYAAGDENLYRYVGNDPIGAVDPSGLSPPSAFGDDPAARFDPYEDWSRNTFGENVPDPAPPKTPPMPLFILPDSGGKLVYSFDAAESTHYVCYKDKRVEQIEQTVSMWDEYDQQTEAERRRFERSAEYRNQGWAARGWYNTTDWFMWGWTGLGKAVYPPSDPSLVLTLEDGSQAMVMSDGPSSAAMAGQALLITGGISAYGSGGARSLAGEFGGEFVEQYIPFASLVRGRNLGLPLGTKKATFVTDAAVPANAIDKSWKLKIEGTAQRTGTPGHQFRTYREAIAEAKNPDVRSVHLDHGYNRGLDLDPKTIQPNRRPDVLSVYNDNRVIRIEVQSATDRPAVLRSRNAAMDAQLRAQGFTPTPPRVVRPTTTP